jgi:hypothetical protein
MRRRTPDQERKLSRSGFANGTTWRRNINEGGFGRLRTTSVRRATQAGGLSLGARPGAHRVNGSGAVSPPTAPARYPPQLSEDRIGELLRQKRCPHECQTASGPIAFRSLMAIFYALISHVISRNYNPLIYLVLLFILKLASFATPSIHPATTIALRQVAHWLLRRRWQ